MQQQFVEELFALCKQNGIDTCLDTSGSVELTSDVLDYTDLVEPFGLDESWLDVTGSFIFGNGREIAEKIRIFEPSAPRHK